MIRLLLSFAFLVVAFNLGCQSASKPAATAATPAPYGNGFVTEAPIPAKNNSGRLPAYTDDNELKVIVGYIISDASSRNNILATDYLERNLDIYAKADLEVEKFEANLKGLAAKADADPTFAENPLNHESYVQLIKYWKISQDQLEKIVRIYDILLSLRVDPREPQKTRDAANKVITEMHEWLDKRTQAEKLQLIELVQELEAIKALHPKTSSNSAPAAKGKFAAIEDYNFAKFQFLHEKDLSAYFKKNKAAIHKRAVASAKVVNPWVQVASKVEIDWGGENRKPSSNKPAIPDPGPDGNFFGLGCPPGTFVLTFDDGPLKSSTSRLLKDLKGYSDSINPTMPATFFVLLHQVEQFPDMIKQEQAQGYGVHSHSYSHPDLHAVSHDERVKQVLDTVPALQQTLGHDFQFFRCPYGSCVAPAVPEVRKMIADSNLIHAHWSIDSLDWKNIGQPQKTFDLITQQMKVTRRGTILMHDIHESSVDALEKLLVYFKQQNDSGAQKLKFLSLEQAVSDYNVSSGGSPLPPTKPVSQ